MVWPRERKPLPLSLSLSMYLVETRVKYGLGMAHAGSPTPAASFAFLPSARERALAADSGFCVSSLFCLSNLYTGRIDQVRPWLLFLCFFLDFEKDGIGFNESRFRAALTIIGSSLLLGKYK